MINHIGSGVLASSFFPLMLHNIRLWQDLEIYAQKDAIVMRIYVQNDTISRSDEFQIKHWGYTLKLETHETFLDVFLPVLVD